MTFERLCELPGAIVSAFGKSVPGVPIEELSAGEYAEMKYPRFPAVMRFHVKRYAAPGFGNIFSMYTRAMGGMMQLATICFTPNLGGSVPLLLIDVMSIGKKKRAAFVEYYDLTENGGACPALEAIAKKHAHLPDYAEKPAWYVAERAPYSLIKGGQHDGALIEMLLDSAEAYGKAAGSAGSSEGNLEGLRAFIERMVKEGNPSTGTMEKVLGKEGAESFFREAIMPGKYSSK